MAEVAGELSAVALAMRALGYENVYLLPPSPRLCCEPIVLTAGAWERESRQADGCERGAREVDVLVCCDDPADAEATCRAVERDLRSVAWQRSGVAVRVAALDTEAPASRGRDSSGRWLWGLKLRLTVVRGL